ncbi:hypothetical protein K239x_08960 [Planctomycetes bacterium K23_9]|uniref:Uncharacterized protein n=1 Tax=Stieleria marina TaxID=1930275 RepID=A0A517NPB4_9BACT|nr:hypothetical protein K239x_08960 [Planctomycetes bacterium K23_9]
MKEDRADDLERLKDRQTFGSTLPAQSKPNFVNRASQPRRVLRKHSQLSSKRSIFTPLGPHTDNSPRAAGLVCLNLANLNLTCWGRTASSGTQRMTEDRGVPYSSQY